METPARLAEALLDRYRIERELGRGGMATVFLARDLRHDRPVAIKVLDRNLVPAHGADRFLQEIRLTARLTHPHVLGVYDSGEADGLLYYVMPYLEGDTLRARLEREGALSPNDARRLIRELAEALAYAHAHGVVHRDLKPENVLLSGGHAVVADFGIAKAVAAANTLGAGSAAWQTATGVSLGTPAYMAPEQAAGDPATDHRADLYALGVVAYEAITGTHPFAGRAPQALLAAHLTETPTTPRERRPDTPPALSALVMHLLAKDPTARPQDAADVVRLLADASPHAAPIRSRHALIAVGVMLVVAASAAALWMRNGTSRDATTLRSLAVLPFENTGGVAGDDYFSDGMTDELAHALARLPGLRLAGRTSSYAFKGKSAPAQEIGKTLDVDAYVGGTVRRAGDRLRVSTQLVSTHDGKVMWDSVYESHSTDVFSVQDQFTRAIVAAIAPTLGGRPATTAKRGTADAEAYDLFLKGRYYWLARGTDNVIRSVGYFKQAIARDPKFARAHAGLAMAYEVMVSFAPDPRDTLPALVIAAASRAVELDSLDADAQLAMGLALSRQSRFRDALVRFRAAVALNPSDATAHQTLGICLLTLGHTDDGIAEFRRGRQLDPLIKSIGTSLVLGLTFARRYAEAIAVGREVLAVDSTYPLALVSSSAAFALSGHPDSAVQMIERARRWNPHSPLIARYDLFAQAAAGRWEQVEQIRARLRQPGGDESGGVDEAFAELVLGNRQPLIRVLSTVAGHNRWVAFGCDPFLDPLWSDDRFRSTMQALGIEPCALARPWPFRPPPRAP